MLTSNKTPKLEKVEMANKICGKKTFVLKNGLRMKDVPIGLYKSGIHIVLRTIPNHRKWNISGECMKMVIHWVDDMSIDILHLLDKKFHFALQESQV